MKKLKKIEFEGMAFEYNPASVMNYGIMKKIARMKKDPVGLFDALEVIFSGRDEEYADMLDGDYERLGNLLNAIFEVEGAKN